MSINDKKGIGFSFKKTKAKPQLRPAHNDDDDEGSNRDFVTSIDEKVIRSTAPKNEKKELIIPLIRNNNWRLKTSKDAKKSDDNQEKKQSALNTESLEDKARRELLREAAAENEKWEKGDSQNSTRVIPLLLQNQAPEGFEEDDNFDVSVRPEQPSLEDYERVPIEEFGVAMLKGMGWKPGDPIGGINKAVVAPVEVNIRPKGLGLGAELPSSKRAVKDSVKNNEDLTLRIGCYVHIEMGQHSGQYGKVEGLDEDLSRAMVRLALTGTNVNVSASLIRVVSRSEYHSEGKVINKARYDEYKEKSKKQSHRSKQY